MNDKEFLEHFGVLGMHWGKRKGKKVASNQSDDHKEKTSLTDKKSYGMSNAELKKVNERMQLEKTYRELNSASVSKGRKFVEDFIQNIGREILADIIKQQVRKVL